LEYDVVILPFTLKLLNLYCLRKFKGKTYGVFGIGVRASYRNTYDSSRLDAYIRSKLLNKLSFAIFYDEYPRIRFAGLGVPMSKLFVAPNTISSSSTFAISEKRFNNFVFIGSLYAEKNVRLLIQAYSLLVRDYGEVPCLDIIGEGPELKSLVELVQELELMEKVIFHGEILESYDLDQCMKNARVVISPGQAGLSVLHAFSCATGFITTMNAKTGGERFNVVDGITGSYFDGSLLGLKSTMQDYMSDTFAKEIGNNAFIYYGLLRGKQTWRKGVLKAIRCENTD